MDAQSALRNSLDYFNHIPLGTLRIRHHRQALVQRSQPPFIVHGQPEQIAIRYLIMSHESAVKVAEGILDWQSRLPKNCVLDG